MRHSVTSRTDRSVEYREIAEAVDATVSAQSAETEDGPLVAFEEGESPTGQVP
jgi:hypothetical protein